MFRRLVRAALAAVILAGPAVRAAAAQDEFAPVLACAAETEPARRLACFDAAVAPLLRTAPDTSATVHAAAKPPVAGPAAAAAAPAAAPVAAASPGDSLSPEEKFGLRGELRREKLGEVSELSATATAITSKPRGELVVTLDNGQVWAEIAPGSKIRLKPGDTVKIEAGTLGSFILIAPNGRASKVSRTR